MDLVFRTIFVFVLIFVVTRAVGRRELSSRRPTARVTPKIRKKTKTVRKTRSMAQGRAVMVRPMRTTGRSASSSSTAYERRPTFVGLTSNWNHTRRRSPDFIAS